MPKDYTPNQFWKLFENLPSDLQDAVFSEKTADDVYEICEHNDIEEVSKLAKIVGRVLLGVSEPEKLPETLQQEFGFEKEKAEKVSKEIERFILYPLELSLSNLYEKTAPKEKPTETGVRSSTEKKEVELVNATEKKSAGTSKKKDGYRESIEEEE
ncbi:MAG: hypothetical protein NTU58_02840 [Candidatus Nealsonbacteria bacterium]|nr:hypothetical protein [Candidatus Nealsonbacteria bacterium]